MKYIILFLLALQCNWIPSYAQTGDSLTCYTSTELKQIAVRVVRAKECDTLLNLCEQQLIYKDIALAAKDSVITSKDSVITLKEDIIVLKEDIITGKDGEIAELRSVLKKRERALTWLKVGWATTSVGLTGLLIYFIVN